MYYDRDVVDVGGLMYYGADIAESYRRVAYFVDRILNGVKPPICRRVADEVRVRYILNTGKNVFAPCGCPELAFRVE